MNKLFSKTSAALNIKTSFKFTLAAALAGAITTTSPVDAIAKDKRYRLCGTKSCYDYIYPNYRSCYSAVKAQYKRYPAYSWGCLEVGAGVLR